MCFLCVQESFEHVRGWLKEASQHAPPGFCKLLVGNKSDRTDRAVPEAEGRALAYVWVGVMGTLFQLRRKSPNSVVVCPRVAMHASHQTSCCARCRDELHMPFLETSARTADNVEAAFSRIAEQLVAARDTAAREEAQEKVDIGKPKAGAGKGGCKCG